MLDRMFAGVSKVFKLLVMLLVIGMVGYSGMCVYANFIQKEPGEYTLPSVSKAKYEIIIHNTGNVIYTDAYEEKGNRYILQSYWELVDNKYRQRKAEIILDQDIFGTITVRRR